MTTPFPAPTHPTAAPKRRLSATTWVLGSIGSFFVLLGLIVGFSPAGRDCGSAFAPDTRVAELADSMSGSYGGFLASCTEDIDSAQSAAALWLGLAAVVFLALAIVAGIRYQARVTSGLLRQMQGGAPGQMPARPGHAPAFPPAGPTVAHRLEELTRLHQQGLITDAEYQAKRQDILSQL